MTGATDPTDTGALDLDGPPLHVHIVGVGGAGMRAIATVLVAMGHRVTGSDMKPSPGLDRLRALGIDVHVGHRGEQVGHADRVAVSTAIPASNPEVVAAHEAGIPVLSRAQVLAAITRVRRTLSVSGTHGKTTTTTMLALILVEAGLSPSFIIGGDVNEIGSGAVWEDGELFVVEADESDGTFTELASHLAVVTNVEADHLDHYGDLAGIEAAFDRFVTGADVAVVCVDEPNAAALAARHGTTTYGTGEGADYRIVDVSVDRVGTRFAVEHHGDVLGRIDLPIPGLHNARNATAALVAALLVGAPFSAAASALGRYAGVARRYQFRGRLDGITFVDDYAHNPGKVAAVVGTAAQGGWGRVVVVFQPHRYSRTEDLWRDFGPSFAGADLVVITDVDGAGEQARPGVTGQLIVDAIAASDPGRDVVYLPDRTTLAAELAEVLRPGDLCLSLGAGDITGLADEVLAARARSDADAAGPAADDGEPDGGTR
ncbi:UDP-N-acetylmuramate--L-alanine ligase [Iamia sp. SCSIO 61187]|uniref:UDP-N-acetylmuramate--L-alanine ligase n=1 Tax=Iamia sp. SCSIO 61187 TaxID=2722752 RepID=UPI001C62A5E0|nr:UDP-N-acetylmuramate--L-alanine ligase [Iamia sp. SCSIO 61187]QYG92800.1 UDP-N-acetylmuramate--L-alanine ligase [Iamia sp. SCSIO 61187]